MAYIDPPAWHVHHLLYLTWCEGMANIRLADDEAEPIVSHVIDLGNRLRVWIFFVTLTGGLLLLRIDGMIAFGLDRLSPCGRPCLRVYGPAEWTALRWRTVSVIAVIVTLPILGLLLDGFAKRGLLPTERRAWRVTLGVSVFGLPVLSFLTILMGLPRLFSMAAADADTLGVKAAYDAASMHRIALGLIWVEAILGLWILATILAILSKAIGPSDLDSWRFRSSIMAAVGLGLGTPTELHEAAFLGWIATFTAIEIIIIWFGPKGADLANGPKTVLDTEGRRYRYTLIDCSCLGGCPQIETLPLLQGSGRVRAKGLCALSAERDMIVDLARRGNWTNAVIVGCDGNPVPRRMINTLDTIGCKVQGLSILDLAIESGLESDLEQFTIAMNIAAMDGPWTPEQRNSLRAEIEHKFGVHPLRHDTRGEHDQKGPKVRIGKDGVVEMRRDNSTE